jgi:hypothetical protein
MLKFFRDITNDQDITITSVYGIKVKPDPRHKKKLEFAIQRLGNRYCLFNSVEKVTK